MTVQPDVQGTGPGLSATGDDVVLSVDRLSVTTRRLSLLTDVSFALAKGERVGLIGESGSGKSLTALALMGLLPEGLRAEGSVRLAGTDHDLVGASETAMSRVRGRRMSMVFQEPMTALNPVMRVGKQVAEGMLLHRTQPSPAAARAAAVELLARVRLPDPASAARAYPHQLSGGQRQRVMLAMALANDPDVLVCDEPTTALDVTVQAQMLELVLEATVERDAGLLFITHDLPVVATVCQRLLVMYGGRVVESGTVEQVLTRPRHHYTRGLLAASDLEQVDEAGRLRTIPGTVPAAGQFPDGCVFRNRCDAEVDRCTTVPAWVEQDGHGHACWNPTELPAEHVPEVRRG